MCRLCCRIFLSVGSLLPRTSFSAAADQLVSTWPFRFCINFASLWEFYNTVKYYLQALVCCVFSNSDGRICAEKKKVVLRRDMKILASAVRSKCRYTETLTQSDREKIRAELVQPMMRYWWPNAICIPCYVYTWELYLPWISCDAEYKRWNHFTLQSTKPGTLVASKLYDSHPNSSIFNLLALGKAKRLLTSLGKGARLKKNSHWLSERLESLCIMGDESNSSLKPFNTIVLWCMGGFRGLPCCRETLVWSLLFYLVCERTVLYK